jgi:hypothetical protein
MMQKVVIQVIATFSYYAGYKTEATHTI